MSYEISEEDFLMHLGTPHAGGVPHSGRYKWGSGSNPGQHDSTFMTQVRKYRAQGFSETDIARAMGLSTGQYRAKITNERYLRDASNIARARALSSKGMGATAIGREMGVSESTVRGWLKSERDSKSTILDRTTEMLKKEVDGKNLVDIGEGVAEFVGISQSQMDGAIRRLKEEGYSVQTLKESQVSNPEQKTTIKVLCPPGMTAKEAYYQRSNVKEIGATFDESSRLYSQHHPEPVSFDSKRLMVRHAEDGGTQMDGVMQLRRGVPDISLGGLTYGQVRIAVDGTHYLKGMAMYGEDKEFPKGVDIIFNSNKSASVGKLGALKKMNTISDSNGKTKIDSDNPFGAVTKPRYYKDAKGNTKQSVINLVRGEGEWAEWSKTLSSQFLSKQSTKLAQQQLDVAYTRRLKEYDDILHLTNPAVKRKLLSAFGDSCDKDAVDLKAAAMPRQATHAILPVRSLKANEIYAPNYRNGETVCLVRFPHGGIFEIPELRVNNNNREAKRALSSGKGFAKDAVGINHKTAAKLSGADFDGDTVLVIPNNKGLVKSSPSLKGLKDFDPSARYPMPKGQKAVKDDKSFNKQSQMGSVSNLITDMTIKGAKQDELARAVRHSMVIIDAEKHNLNWRQSYQDNHIAELKTKYQGKTKTGQLKGASTIISRASSKTYVNSRKPRNAMSGGPIDPKTGKKMWTETGSSYSKFAYRDPKTGRKVWTTYSKLKKLEAQGYLPKNYKPIDTKKVIRQQAISKMEATDNAFTLSSGSKMEDIYAVHANRVKALGNRARKEYLATKPYSLNRSAQKTYSVEIATLKANLNQVLKNKPLERKANLIANQIVRAKRMANPDMDDNALKNLKVKALSTARDRTGASRAEFHITPRQWEAIQAHAVSNSMLEKILKYADTDQIKALATPLDRPTMSSAMISRAKALAAGGRTQADIAEMLGVSTSTIQRALK